MKQLIILGSLVMALSAGSVLAGGGKGGQSGQSGQSGMSGEVTPKMREQMAKVYSDMASCLKSDDQTVQECRTQFMQSCRGVACPSSQQSGQMSEDMSRKSKEMYKDTKEGAGEAAKDAGGTVEDTGDSAREGGENLDESLSQ